MLAKPFLFEHQKLPSGIVPREMNDPYYWKDQSLSLNQVNTFWPTGLVYE